jgi:multidrug resistance efflux pump
MRVGQPVSVRVDAFPDHRLNGRIDSFQRGTGSNFALLPPENATSNFVKVVQRVPVKIVLEGPADALRSISRGMSVEPTVTIAPPPSWLQPFLSLIGNPGSEGEDEQDVLPRSTEDVRKEWARLHDNIT